MMIEIKPMETEAEIRGKAYVHWKSWQEAYAGIVDAGYLADLTLEKCEERAFRWTENLLVAKVGSKVVGFAGYGACGDEDLPGAGEVFAIYVLPEYCGAGVGGELMRAALDRLGAYDAVAVWVLRDNARAIRFYEKWGYRADGAEKTLTLGTPVSVIRMLLRRQNEGPLVGEG